MRFALDARLESSSAFVADLPLCHVRLQDDRRWPWLVLIPRRPRLREAEDLAPEDRARMLDEAVLAGRAVRALGDAAGRPVEKLNLGALGNIVPQLHLHVVGRRADDPAWPGPVWGFGAPESYNSALADAINTARRWLDRFQIA